MKIRKKSSFSPAPSKQFAQALGRRLRQLRAFLDLSQTDVAGRVGPVATSSWSELERGSLVSLRMDILAGLAALCAEAGISLEWLLTGAGTMHLGAAPLAEATREQLMRALAGQFNKELLAQAGIRLAESPQAAGEAAQANIGPVAGPFRAVSLHEPGFRVIQAEEQTFGKDWRGKCVPIIGRLAAGEGVDTIEAEEGPPGWADSFLLYQDAPPGAFALRVVGASMEPEYRDGDMLVVDPGQPVRSGVCCVIYAHDGERTARLKKLGITRRTARLESLNPDFKPVSVPAKDVQAYAVIAHLPRVVERTVS